MTKEHILDEIKRTAAGNGGRALGLNEFLRETGIKKADWFGKYWARWGDAITEAGLEPNQLQEAYEIEVLVLKLMSLMRELGRFPAKGDLLLKVRRDPGFPSYITFQRRLGSKTECLSKVVEYCRTREDTKM